MLPVTRCISLLLLLLLVVPLSASALSPDLDLNADDVIREELVVPRSQGHRHRHQQEEKEGVKAKFRREGHHASVVRQLTSVTDGDQSPHHSSPSQCPDNCVLHVHDINKVRARLVNMLEDGETRLIHFRLTMVQADNASIEQLPNIMEVTPYMTPNFHAAHWLWASGSLGRRLLGLPLDADVLSLYLLDARRRSLELRVYAQPASCLVMHTPECRLDTVRRLLIDNITSSLVTSSRSDVTAARAFICHRVVVARTTDDFEQQQGSVPGSRSRLVYRCCDTVQFTAGDRSCDIYTSSSREVAALQTVIDLAALVIVCISPFLLIRIKMALKFENVTKFFRASLKHGITGQRNYVIRISSRQLVNLADPKPFSLPRVIFRLIFHCYGEGRCLIQCWGQWRAQPNCCKRQSVCRRLWLVTCRVSVIFIFYPAVIYVALALYSPAVTFYSALVAFTEQWRTADTEGRDAGGLQLDMTVLGLALVPGYWPELGLWLLFSLAAFLHCLASLMWPGNPLERCLLEYDGRRPNFEPPHLFHKQVSQSYRGVLQRLTYGDAVVKRHLFRISVFPWLLRRLAIFLGQLLLQIPVINVAAGLMAFDASLFRLRAHIPGPSVDETKGRCECPRPSHHTIIQCSITLFVWCCFTLVFSGYCTTVFVIAQFSLNVAFFALLACILHASFLLPPLCACAVVAFYINDALAAVNQQHRDILKLIDDNSPRISALEDAADSQEGGGGGSSPSSGGGSHILRTHNLGAVKFIDADNVQFVSKELYYNVCQDLKCGWSRCLRRLALHIFSAAAFVLLVFTALAAVGSLIGSTVTMTTVAVVVSLSPKLARAYARRKRGNDASSSNDVRAAWVKVIPDILDRHIRVDSSRFVDDWEEELTTYDVRSVGLLEMTLPRAERWNNLQVWKFAWTVSADQQTYSPETFIIAFANKQASAAFLTKVVTREYAVSVEEEDTLRQWSLLVENCIVDGSAAASRLNGAWTAEAERLFPEEVAGFVSRFDPGHTVDAVVDSINRELYRPGTKGILVTIGNTTFATVRLADSIFAFNSSCHSDQVTDLFGAVLIKADFNIQNLHQAVTYVIDPYAPDSVPVYSAMATDGYIFRSVGDAMQHDTPTASAGPEVESPTTEPGSFVQ